MQPNFSQRMGVKPMRIALQLGTMDGELRTAIWNGFYEIYLSTGGPYPRNLNRYALLERIWRDLFHWRLDELPDFVSAFRAAFRRRFDESSWSEVYDLVEFALQHDDSHVRDRFRRECERALEQHASGYRLFGEEVVPITDEQELNEIDTARDDTSSLDLAGARSHLDSAIGLLSDRANPDYRNSIKESISAVESVLRCVAGDPSLTVGTALSRIKARKLIDLHQLIQAAIEKLYAYTNQEGGIRHAMMEEPEIGFAEAKYMLVSAAATVNLLIAKASEASIDLGARAATTTSAR